jgi:iron complex transport system substrate-binding protein
VLLLSCTSVATAADRPSVASINLCTDQLVLSIADPAQIATVSWLAADPQESMLATEASQYPLNYGSAEEILRINPDIVVGGLYTSSFTRALLEDLGFTVVTISPASSISDIERNLRTVAAAIDQVSRAEKTISQMRQRIVRLRQSRSAAVIRSVVVRPGGYTVGANSLADDLLELAGLHNIAAANGLDKWGSLSVESLLVSRPQLIVFTGYRDAPSLANEVFSNPLLAEISTRSRSTSIDATYWACGIPESLRSAELLAATIRAERW